MAPIGSPCSTCTGKRPFTESPIDSADYGFLQEVDRLVDASKRLKKDLCVEGKTRKFNWMRSQCYRRHFRFATLPAGMERAKLNKTTYIPQKKTILWTIEWKFHSPTNITIIDHDVDEHTIMSNIITKLLELPQWRKQLVPYCETQLEDLNFFLSKNEKNPKALFRKLDVNEPLRKILAGITILEFPVIHVYLPSESYDFKVQSPLRIPLREEEIEEGGIDMLENILSTDDVGSTDNQLLASEDFKLAPDDSKAFLSDEGEDLSSGGN